MAQPTNLYDTFDTTGIREDLTDVIYNISPEDTPILSAIPRSAAKSLTQLLKVMMQLLMLCLQQLELSTIVKFLTK